MYKLKSRKNFWSRHVLLSNTNNMVHHRNTALLDDKGAWFDSNVLDFEVILSYFSLQDR